MTDILTIHLDAQPPGDGIRLIWHADRAQDGNLHALLACRRCKGTDVRKGTIQQNVVCQVASCAAKGLDRNPEQVCPLCESTILPVTNTPPFTLFECIDCDWTGSNHPSKTRKS